MKELYRITWVDKYTRKLESLDFDSYESAKEFIPKVLKWHNNYYLWHRTYKPLNYVCIESKGV